MQAHFQKFNHLLMTNGIRKRGWIHQDIDTWFGGIVYLTKDPEPDTGTQSTKQRTDTLFNTKMRLV